MPDNTLTVGELLIVISAVVPILQREGLMDAAGQFKPGSVSDWSRVAADVEAELKQFLLVPQKIDQIMAALPLVLSLVGIH